MAIEDCGYARDNARRKITELYLFENIDSAQYLVYAIPNPEYYKNYFPTFYVNSFDWSQANLVNAFGNTFGVDIYLENINALENGPGIIEGEVIYEDTSSYEISIYNSSWFNSVPTQGTDISFSAQNIPVVLIFDNKPVGWLLSDSNGRFVFNNIPVGNYQLLIQKPGMPMYNMPSITLDEETTGEDNIKIFIRSSDIFTSIENNKTECHQ